jgi:hypothetical protein
MSYPLKPILPLIVFAIMATSGTVVSASYEPKLQTAGDFLETCPASTANHSMEELSRFSFCMGLVRGILLASSGAKAACMPSGESLFNAVDVIRAWVKVHPRERKMDIRRAVMRALGEKYPCKV